MLTNVYWMNRCRCTRVRLYARYATNTHTHSSYQNHASAFSHSRPNKPSNSKTMLKVVWGTQCKKTHHFCKWPKFLLHFLCISQTLMKKQTFLPLDVHSWLSFFHLYFSVGAWLLFLLIFCCDCVTALPRAPWNLHSIGTIGWRKLCARWGSISFDGFS